MDKIVIANGANIIGRRGENEAVRLLFPIAPWREQFGSGGSFQLVAQRHNDAAPYPVAIEVDDRYVYWTVNAADTAVVGNGTCELYYYVDDTLAKSVIYTTLVFESMDEPGEAPEPQAAWLEQVLGYAVDAEIAAVDAAASADAAAGSATSAAESASYTAHPPVIGINENWWLWNGTAYVDSGLPSRGATGPTGETGATGNGIAVIEQTSTSGLVDTYTITFTNGTTTTFTVTNGKDGTDGEDGVGIRRIEKTSTSGLVDTYTITYTDDMTTTFTVTNGRDGEDGAPGAAAGFGTPTATVDGNVGTPAVVVTASGPDTAKIFAFAFANLKGQTGETGATGNGIQSIEKTGSSGLLDTYTITYTNGNTDTFTVTNGEDGQDGDAAGFGTPTATVDGNVGTPGVTVTASGPDTAKIFAFAFTNLKGETGQTGQTGATGNGIQSITKTGSSGNTDTYTILYTNGDTDTFTVTNGIDGQDGAPGQDGAAAGFGTPTATIDGNVGTPGVTVTASGPDTAKVFAFAFTNLKGETGQTGATGATGNGIASIAKTGSSGLVDTYTITYTNGNTATFTVTNGADGAPGRAGADGTDGTDGISPAVTITSITGGHTVTITDADHPSGQSFNIMDGQDGDPGPAGPNEITANTDTTLSGILAGNGSKVETRAVDIADLSSGVQSSLGKADTAYQKPSGGIPESDLSSGVQSSLGKADSAYQKPSGGIPSSDMASAVQTSLGKADTAYQKPSGGIPASDLAPGVIPTVPSASTSNPAMDGTASSGSSTAYARGDHVHPSDTTKLGTSGDGSNVTAAFTAASSRTNISTGEKLTVIFGKIAKWFADLGAAAFRGVDSVPTDNSTNLVESGGVKSALTQLEDDINDVYTTVPAVVEESVSSFFSNKLSDYSVDPVASTGLLVTLHPNTSYDSYYLYPSRSCSLWFASTPSASYVALAKISNASAIYLAPGTTNVYRIDGTNAARYRKSESNLPTESNKLSLSAGMAVLITIPKTVSADNVTFMVDYGSSRIDKTLFNNSIKLNKTQVNQVKQTNYVEYVSGAGDDSSTEHINVYLGQNNGFIKYEFLHSVSASINSNVWRLGYTKQVDASFEDVATITTKGEWECALKLSGRSDFAGGFLHGDEVTQSITFLINGKVRTISALSGKVQFDKLQIVQKSNLYDPNDSTTVFAVHTSLHEFTDKLKIKQSVVFSGAYTLDVSYLAMYPISKTYSANYYTDQNYEYQAVSIPVFQTAAREVSLFGGNIASTFALKEQTENLNSGGLSILDNGGNLYNKCYFGICGSNTAVSSGEVWKATTEFNISV